MPLARRRCYLDTSAYLCVLLGEKGSQDLIAELDGAELLSSSLLVLEAQRNLVRMSRAGLLKPAALQDALDRLAADEEQLVLRDLTLDLCATRSMPVVSTPRSLDLAHLRTALWFHQLEPLAKFVTIDESQRQAARELGLPV